MPELAPPRTHHARMAFLDSAAVREACLGLLPSWLAAKLDTQRQRFAAMYEQANDLTAERCRLLGEKEQALAGLNMLIRHYWHGIRVQVRLGQLPTEAFLHLGLNQAGRNLRLVRIGEKLNAARLLVGGAEHMTSLGWTLHQQPAACEIEASAGRVLALSTRYGEKDRQLARLQIAMKEEVIAIRQVYGQVYQSIRASLLDRSAAEKRLILRHYGYIFRYRRDRDRPATGKRQRPGQETVRAEHAAKRANHNSAHDEEIRSLQDRYDLGHLEMMRSEPDREPERVDREPGREERQRRATMERQFMRRLVRNDPYRRSKNRRRRSTSMRDRPIAITSQVGADIGGFPPGDDG